MNRSKLLVGSLVVLASCLGDPSGAGDLSVDLATPPKVLHLDPSGGDDTAALQLALDVLAEAGGGQLSLGPGVFVVTRPLVASNFSGVIRGAGMDATALVADGTTASGPFPNLPAAEAQILGVPPFPILLAFAEGATDRFGEPAEQRSLDVTLSDLTLGTRGRTEIHFDINEFAETQRLFSLVWMVGDRALWTNSAGQTPPDIGHLDDEHRRISTVRGRFTHVAFDGRNRARADDEPGGPYDAAPDVRNGFGIEGGIALVQPIPDPIFYFKPVNAALDFVGCRFNDLPGQAGIFGPVLIGRNDPSWTFGPEAVAGHIRVRDTSFRDVFLSLLIVGISDFDVDIAGSESRGGLITVVADAGWPEIDGGGFGYPPSQPSKVRVRDSLFQGAAEAAVETLDFQPSALLNVDVRDNRFILTGPGQAGVIGIGLTGDTDVAGNTFQGEGYAGVVTGPSFFGWDGAGWRIVGNDFCGLDINPGASAPEFWQWFLPANETGAAVLLAGTVGTIAHGGNCLTVGEGSVVF